MLQHVFFFFLFLAFSFQNEEKVHMSIHSFTPPYLYGVSQNIPFWDYGASAIATENFVRLVPSIQSRNGWLWNSQPNNMDNWEAILEFRIHNTNSPGADGLGFWIAKTPKKEGSLYGYDTDFEGVGVIFDTYDNNHNGDNPAVILIQNDGRHREWDIENDLLNDQIDRCLSHFRNPINDKATAKISYRQGKLEVAMDTFGKGEFRDCISSNIVIPKGYYFGFTAATGGLTDFHDVLSFSVSEVDHTIQIKNQDQEGASRKGWFDPYKNSNDENTPEILKEQEKEEILQESSSRIQQKLQQQLEKERKLKEERESSSSSSSASASAEETDEYFDTLRKRLEELGHGKSGNIQSSTVQKKDSSSSSSMPVDHDPSDNAMSHETGVIIIEALEEVVSQIRHGSTKGDISALMRRVEAVSEIQQEIGDLMLNRNQEIQEELQGLSTKLGKQTDSLNEELKKLDRILNSLSSSVSDMQRKQGFLQKEFDSARTDISQTITETGTWGYAMWFILFQIIFIISFFFYKKYADEKRRKFL